MFEIVLSIVLAVVFIAVTHPPYRESLKTCLSNFIKLFKNEEKEKSLEQFMVLVKDHGVGSPEVIDFYETHKNNRQFRKQADTIIRFEEQIKNIERASKESTE